MMAALQEQNSQNMQLLQKSNMEAVQAIIANVRPQSLTDSRGIGKPVTFKGEEKKYAEWKAKMMASRTATSGSLGQWRQRTASLKRPSRSIGVSMQMH